MPFSFDGSRRSRSVAFGATPGLSLGRTVSGTGQGGVGVIAPRVVERTRAPAGTFINAISPVLSLALNLGNARNAVARGFSLAPRPESRVPEPRDQPSTVRSVAQGTGATLAPAPASAAAVLAGDSAPAATVEERRRRRAGLGRGRDVLTGSLGVAGAAPVFRKVLLGE